ncbi:MAG TPA: helix-turn-helix transcriptional regulator [Polyangia bacterium]|jgi:ribosome-binding protein aMBF1 (putative translation factor)
MIRTDTEYRDAARRLEEERKRLSEHEARLKTAGLGRAELRRALDPLRSFPQQLAEEVESYERLKRGDVGALTNLHGLGRMLVALRLAVGLSQRDLAARLGIHESQVSRDERSEYHGITLERASRILDALGVRLRSAFEEPVAPPAPDAAHHEGRSRR